MPRAAPLAADDFEIGQWVTFLEAPEEWPSKSLYDDIASQPTRVKHTQLPEPGVPLQIKGIHLPFVVVESPYHPGNSGFGSLPLDIREFRLMRVSPEYAAAWDNTSIHYVQQMLFYQSCVQQYLAFYEELRRIFGILEKPNLIDLAATIERLYHPQNSAPQVVGESLTCPPENA